MAVRATGNAGHWSWYFQRVTGIALVLTLTAHFAVNHFMRLPDAGGAEWAGSLYRAAVLRLSNPLYKGFELTFLMLATYHACNGLWAIARDVVTRPLARTTLFMLIVLAGFALAVVGWTAILPIDQDWLARGAAANP